jgi:hypothetical protein
MKLKFVQISRSRGKSRKLRFCVPDPLLLGSDSPVGWSQVAEIGRNRIQSHGKDGEGEKRREDAELMKREGERRRFLGGTRRPALGDSDHLIL